MDINKIKEFRFLLLKTIYDMNIKNVGNYLKRSEFLKLFLDYTEDEIDNELFRSNLMYVQSCIGSNESPKYVTPGYIAALHVT